MTIGQFEQLFSDALSALYGSQEAKSLAWISISHICRLNRTDYLAKKNEEIQARDEVSLTMILDELKTGKPLQYVLGETEFYGLRFKVNPDVLIPRPETEELVDWILKSVKELKTGSEVPLKILDIGTGSGCIPISIKKNLPEAEIKALDISAGALATAMTNAVLNSAEIVFIHDDILDPQDEKLKKASFDIIVSNPPYVTMSEKDQMHRNVLDHEPHTALFVPDQDPLIFYSAIAEYALNHLQKNGMLFLEINENLGKETVDLMRNKGFNRIELRQDLPGRDRMVKAQF